MSRIRIEWGSFTLGFAACAAVTISACVLSAAAYAAPAPNATAQEDSPGWSCVDDGNRICGPGNSEGKPAACYDEGGVIVALWPCHVIVNQDGSADAYDDALYARGYTN